MDVQTLKDVLQAVNEKVRHADMLEKDDFRIGALAALGGVQQMLEDSIAYENELNWIKENCND